MDDAFLDLVHGLGQASFGQPQPGNIVFAAGIDSMVPAFARKGVWLFVFLFVVVFFRAQTTYWLARGVISGAVLAIGRQGFLDVMACWFDGPALRKGVAMLDK